MFLSTVTILIRDNTFAKLFTMHIKINTLKSFTYFVLLLPVNMKMGSAWPDESLRQILGLQSAFLRLQLAYKAINQSHTRNLLHFKQ